MSISPHYLKLWEHPEGTPVLVASTVDITNAGQIGRIHVDIDVTGRILGVERLDGPVDVETLRHVLRWAVSPTVPGAARRWHLPATDPTTAAERDAACAAMIFMNGAIPAQNAAGGGWVWSDRTGASLSIGGVTSIAADPGMEPSAAQWAQITLVAEAMAAQVAAAQTAGHVDVDAQVRTIG